MKRVIACGLWCAVVLAMACGPVGMSDEVVDVTGEFDAAGHCNAQTPRAAVIPGKSGRTFHDAGGISGMAPAGFVVHQIRCSATDSAGRELPDYRRAVLLLFAVRAGQYVVPGRYRVGAIAPTALLDSVPAVLVDFRVPAYDKGTRGAGFGEFFQRVKLEGLSGTFEVTRNDTNTVGIDDGIRDITPSQFQATFHIRTRRNWN